MSKKGDTGPLTSAEGVAGKRRGAEEERMGKGTHEKKLRGCLSKKFRGGGEERKAN